MLSFTHNESRVLCCQAQKKKKEEEEEELQERNQKETLRKGAEEKDETKIGPVGWNISFRQLKNSRQR